ncbi:MAG: CYTH domain-containing protein [Porphyromonas sp.]|nr:CYTH domain-containing protein [Bacteroidales bacterium]MDD7559958.1 CYTH domain-containing protein [Bacteroidales bacterium]MDY3100343.1 CYTH domain-containing protein [Porphyromonas sp.]
MGVEIERRFLLKEGATLPDSDRVLHMRQAYLVNSEGLSVRIRVTDDTKAFLTIKRITPGGNIAVRDEFEYEIPVDDALRMMSFSTLGSVKKQRHVFKIGEVTWEVDFFEDENEGLIMAEVELPSFDTPVDLPEWIGREVSDDPAYLSSNLAIHPYTSWTPK